MPFKSKAQMRYLYATHKELAEKWRREYPNQNIKKLPEHKKENKRK